MRRELGQLLLLTALSLPGTGALALEGDASEPIEIAADQLELDDRQGTAVYSGSVDMQQGSMQLNAARVEIRRGGNGQVSLVTARGGGGRAYLAQTPAPDDDQVEGWGDTVIYHAADRRVELIGNAELHQGGDTFDGAYVEYFLDSRRVSARSSRSGEDEGDGRVRMTLTPRQTQQ